MMKQLLILLPALVLASLPAGASSAKPGPGVSGAGNVPALEAEFVAGEIVVELTAETVGSAEANGGLWSSGRTGLPNLDLGLGEIEATSVRQVFDLTVNTETKRARGMDRFLLVRYAAPRSPLEVSTLLADAVEVAEATPNWTCQVALSPDDPLYDTQWAHDNEDPEWTADCDMDTDLAWDLETGASWVVVAILDTGMDLTHPEYEARVVDGYDFVNDDDDPSDDNGHGTACAGIVAAAGDNALGVAGVAWRVRPMSVKVLDSGGSGNLATVAEGMEWAVDNGADILSMSLSSFTGAGVLETAVEYVVQDKGKNVFASTGNDNQSAVNYPARYEDAIAVGAHSPCDERKSPSSCDGETWWGSNWGTGIDVMAPGVLIATTDRQGSAGYTSGDYVSNFNGTSAAAPLAAGVGALILSMGGSVDESFVESRITTTCTDMGGSGWDSQTGYGRVNAYLAVLAARPGVTWVKLDPLDPTVEDGTYHYPYNTLSEGVTFTASGGTLTIKPSSTNGPFTLDKAMTIEAFGGSVTIGS